MKSLGIDYGQSNIGVAFGDTNVKIASPFCVIKNKSEEFVLEELQRIIKEEGIENIVIGAPVNMSGEETEQTAEVFEFIKLLKTQVNCEVVIEDERLTTRFSDSLLQGHKKKGESTDDVAAMLILQMYFDRLS